MKSILSSEFFNFEYVRVLGMAPVGGAEVGECLEVAAKIKKNDPESWYRAWSEAAAIAEGAGEQALEARDRETARLAFLRASNYHRASELYEHVPILVVSISNTILLVCSTYRPQIHVFWKHH